jgi:hypothetical protein
MLAFYFVEKKERKMTNKIILWAMLAMVLVFGMTVVGCDLFGDNDNDKDRPPPFDIRPYLLGIVKFNKGVVNYPVVGETFTATFEKVSGSSDPIGTPSWTWYKTQENVSYSGDVKNKTSLGSGTTYTVRSSDVGFWIWAEVSYSGNQGTSGGRISMYAVLSDPRLPGYVILDKNYPVIGETITASLSSSSGTIGTPSWTWYKTTQDASYLEDVTNKTSLSSGTTYTVKQNDQGFWIWAEVSYSGNSGTQAARTGSPVIGIPATATVSVSVEAVRRLSSYINNHHRVTITLTLSDGRWNNVSYNTASQWLTITGSPTLALWPNSLDSPSVSARGQKLEFYYETGSDTTMLPINLTVALNTAQLSTMRSNTNVYNTLTAGTPSTVSVSQWTILQ